MRTGMTPEELHLYLDFFRYEKIKVRRQALIGGYIADFLVPHKKLIIELDGKDHFTYAGRLYDEKRDRFLKSQGYTVLRFENREVRQNFEKVCLKIEKYL